MTRLLVSVRNADEAESALAGGADLVDVKEPTRGALGRADNEVVAEIVSRVAGRRPVSAAVGELRSWREDLPPMGLAFVKWGLAGYGGTESWREDLSAVAARVGRERPGCGTVAVAYADWRVAEAPEVGEVGAFASRLAAVRRTARGRGSARFYEPPLNEDAGPEIGVLLLDTWKKDGATLLDWLSYRKIERLCCECRGAGLYVALAGALGQREIHALRAVQADWIAVRGAACAEGDRIGGIVRERVRVLKDLLTTDNATCRS